MNPEPLPLLEASRRLRRPPGRPRKPTALADQASGLPAGPPLARAGERAVAVVWLKQGGEWTPCQARLLDLAQAGAYLGVSGWTIRDYVATGILARVTLPTTDGGSLKRLLFDVADLDALIAAGKGDLSAAGRPGEDRPEAVRRPV